MKSITEQIKKDLNGHRELQKLAATYLKRSKDKSLSKADRDHYYYKYLKCRYENELIHNDLEEYADQLMPLILRIEIEDMVAGHEI